MDVLASLRNPEQYERALHDLGAKVTRTAEPPRMAWDCSLLWRDEARNFSAIAEEIAEEETISFAMTSDLALADLRLDLYDLPDGGCRVIGSAELTARTVIAKLALQSLRLVRGKAEDRLSRFILALARH